MADQFKHTKRAELDYMKSIRALINHFYGSKINNAKSAEEVIAILNEKKELFTKYAKSFVKRMVTSLKEQNARSWREAASKGTKGRAIYEAIKTEKKVGEKVIEIVKTNSELISSLPETMAEDVSKFIQKQMFKGERAEAVTYELLKRPEIVAEVKKRVNGSFKTRIALIARTETSKASVALTRARAEELDLDWYVWRTSKDARVRSSHYKMDGVLVRWSDAPSPEQLNGEKSKLGHYHAGDSPNCRCYPEPVVFLDMVNWPAKVYAFGVIQRMTRAQFQKLNTRSIAA